MSRALPLQTLAKPIIIFGSNDLEDSKLVRSTLNELTQNFVRCHVLLRIPSPTSLTQGAEKLIEEWACKNLFPMRQYFPHKRDEEKMIQEMIDDATDHGKRKAYVIGIIQEGDKEPFIKTLLKKAKKNSKLKIKTVYYQY